MRLDSPTRSLGRVPARALRLAVRDREPELWLGPPTRESWFRVHAQTRSALLLWAQHRDFPQVTLSQGPLLPQFEPALRPILRAFEALYPRCGLANLILAMLPPGGTIPAHTDHSPFFAAAHRLHVPLFTNDDVTFTVDGAAVRMEASHLYEIDNRRTHAVHNGGGEPRVHLIADLLPLGAS